MVAVSSSVEDKEEALVETGEDSVCVETSVATLVGVSDVEATVVSVVSVLDTSTGAEYTIEDQGNMDCTSKGAINVSIYVHIVV